MRSISTRLLHYRSDVHDAERPLGTQASSTRVQASERLVACLEPANVNDSNVCARQNLPAVALDRCTIGGRRCCYDHVDEDLVAVSLDIAHPSMSARSASLPVPGQQIATGLTRRVRVVGRAPANLRVEQLCELTEVGRIQRNSNAQRQSFCALVFGSRAT